MSRARLSVRQPTSGQACSRARAGDLGVLRPCGDRQVSRRPQSCPTRLTRERSARRADGPTPKSTASGDSGGVRRVARRPPLRSGYFGLRPQSRACGASPASLPFAGRPLPTPASANLRAVLRRRDAGSSPRAVFAARAPNRVRPSLSARREAAPPAPHAKSFSRSARLGHTARRAEWRDGSRCVERRPESLRVFSRERRTRRDLASNQRFRAEAEAARSIDGADGLPRGPRKTSERAAARNGAFRAT